MTQYFLDNWLEMTGAVLSLLYLFFSINEKSALWLFGFLSSALYIAVFFDARLYADVSLQCYYLGVSIFGWINWTRKRPDTTHTNTQLQVSKIIGTKKWTTYALATLLIYLIYLMVLLHLTDTDVPYADSIVGALSVIATWMLAKKKIENWLIWIAVDAFAAALYFYKGLHITAGLFIIYTVMAYIGYRKWQKTLLQQTNK